MSMLEQGAAPSFIEWGGCGDASSTQSPGALRQHNFKSSWFPQSPSDHPLAKPHRSLHIQPMWHTLLLIHFKDEAGEAQSHPDLTMPRGS